MDDGQIRYEDLISPDNSIKSLIEQLTELNRTYGTVLEVVKTGAKDIITQLKSMSAATNEGRAEIDEATAAANRLARAQKELRFAMSDTGKEVAWLKSQVASQNKMSAEMRAQSQALVGSYDRLKSELKENIALWKSLSESERTGGFGSALLNNIMATKQRLSDLDGQLKIHVQSMSAVEKAEQKLAFLRSDEGKRLMELKQLIADEIAANKTKKATIDEVTQAQERLRAAQDASRRQAYELNIQAKEANRIAKLQAQLNLSEEGSYNRLAAQYELNKIKLNAMSAAEREAEGAGKQLEAETLAIYIKMQKLQEATGNHRLSVGNYAKSWDGLGIAVSQVVRELPAAAVSMNTFFLGISNNIPILMDEINKLRAENKKAIAEGKQAKSVIGSIASAMFSWNTLLVVGLTALSMHGKEIINWISTLFKSHSAIKTTNELLADTTKELEKTNGSYGQNVATVRKLAVEWQNLSSKKEQIQWIRDNKSEFDKLNISITNVSDAENVFVNNTSAMIEALRLRAKAAAAMKLAAEAYEKSLQKQLEAEQEEYDFELVRDKKSGKVSIKKTKKPIKGAYAQPAITPGVTSYGVMAGQSRDTDNEKRWHDHINNMYEEAEAAEKLGDMYFYLSEGYEQEATSKLRSVGIDEMHRPEPKTRTHKDREKHPQQRDLTDQIWRNDLAIRKKYELSMSELQRDEFQKRRIEAVDQANQTIREMEEKFRKNKTFLTNPDGKFKPLSAEQRKQIEQQQQEITAIIENARRKLEIELFEIDQEEELNRIRALRIYKDRRIDIIAESLEEEKKLRLKQLDDLEAEYSSTKAKDENGELILTGVVNKEQLAKWHAERERIEAEYDEKIYTLKQQSIEAQLELVEKGTKAELSILLERNEIARKLAIAENRQKPVEQRQNEGQINMQFAKRAKLITGQFSMESFDQAQKAAEAEFNIVKHNEHEITIFKLEAERDRWKKQIELAKSGALDWTAAQLKEAEAMIRVLNREIGEEKSFTGLIGEKGLGGALLTKLGLNDEQIDALSEATDIVLDNIKSIVDAEVEAAEAAVAAAEKRVSAAQSAYDAEIEARNNGYANNVATAKKELQQERKNQAQKEKLLREAQRRQEAINTMTQASSLVTASANLWEAFSPIPIVGPALALAAIATMWTSFAVAKVRAAQITKSASQEYGEGGLEILEGGSHASGNDIDLQTRNSRGKNMRAEGGEAMAIINKRSTRKYRKALPQIVDSLNKGTFEDKFLGAFDTGDKLSQTVNYFSNVDLSQLKDDVRALKQNSENSYYILPNGSFVEKRKNVIKIIH